jgi:hypothetical protein
MPQPASQQRQRHAHPSGGAESSGRQKGITMEVRTAMLLLRPSFLSNFFFRELIFYVLWYKFRGHSVNGRARVALLDPDVDRWEIVLFLK